MRKRLGDEEFFAQLGGSAGDAGWGTLGSGWDVASYDAARHADPGDADRSRLVSDLVGSLFSSFTSGAGCVDLDHGISVVSGHVQQLGYDVVVLFLDELVLWLASRISDQAFVANEGAKVAKLVEAADMRRPVPLVSFIARQRDLTVAAEQLRVGAVVPVAVEPFEQHAPDPRFPGHCVERGLQRVRPARPRPQQPLLHDQRQVCGPPG